ncbi:MAG TPA: cyclic nucleotide-binding domain-containing protein [Methylomirabilota bacterium]|nr:cyclic nucleotide-binding domain-containing protein [Methylomirabilota bacterium]
MSVQTRTFRAGEVIFREGDVPRDEAFLVHAGRVEVRKKVGDEERLLRTFVKGERLGAHPARPPRWPPRRSPSW